jgi:hypothetical protein
MKRTWDQIHILTPENDVACSKEAEIRGQNVYVPSLSSLQPPALLTSIDDEYSNVAELCAALHPLVTAPVTATAPPRTLLPKRLQFRPIKMPGTAPPSIDSFATLGIASFLPPSAPSTRKEQRAHAILTLLAHLLPCSARLRTLYAQAPRAPHLDFHHVNVLLGALKALRPDAPPRLAQQVLAFVTYAFEHYLPPDHVATPPSSPFVSVLRYLYPLQLLLGSVPRLTVDFACAEQDPEDPEHHGGLRLEGLFTDALRVQPDEDCASLAELWHEFELQLVPEHATCHQGHAWRRAGASYGPWGPPPLLWFEAAAAEGIPPHLLNTAPEPVLLLGQAYVFVAALLLQQQDDTMIVQTVPDGTHGHCVMLIVYAQR